MVPLPRQRKCGRPTTEHRPRTPGPGGAAAATASAVDDEPADGVGHAVQGRLHMGQRPPRLPGSNVGELQLRVRHPSCGRATTSPWLPTTGRIPTGGHRASRPTDPPTRRRRTPRSSTTQTCAIKCTRLRATSSTVAPSAATNTAPTRTCPTRRRSLFSRSRGAEGAVRRRPRPRGWPGRNGPP